jgi:hypothetical protein
VSRAARAGHVVIADIDYPAFLSFLLFAEQAIGELGYVRGEAS